MLLRTLIAALAFVFYSFPVAAQTTYTVTSTADNGSGSLRQALIDANTHPNGGSPDQILFTIAGSGLQTIVPATALPTITDPVVIDGYTQPDASANTLTVGNNAVLLIELNGNGATFPGLTITAGGSTIRGLVIDKFDGNGAGYGLFLETGGGNTVTGNWIGVDPTGTLDHANSRGGIFMMNSSSNVIGGTAPGDRNVIIGQGNYAIFDQGTGGSHTIQGNYVGTNASGTAALARGDIALVSSGNVIGGTAAGAGNVLSTGGGVSGVQFSEEGASNNTVQGNFIGVTADGTAALMPTGGDGIYVLRAGGIQIGGTTVAARNVIVTTGNSVNLVGSPTSGAGHTVQGNYIGTNAAGTATLLGGTAAGAGVRIADSGNNLIGGTDPGARNVIAGNAVGVMFYDARPGNVVQGNYIGTNATGTAALSNGEGMLFAGFGFDNGNQIGGTMPGAGNVISGSVGDGIRFGRGNNNIFEGNAIGVAADYSTPLGNGAHGIELGVGDGNVFGGTTSGAGNVIAYNGLQSGTSLYGIVLFSGTGNVIQGNAIYGNSRIGINLSANDGVTGATPNDPGDADTGPNNLQNAPEIMGSTLAGGQLTVTYVVDSDPANAAYPLRVEVFRAYNGEGGAAFLGADTYTSTDHSVCGSAPCTKTFSFTPVAPVVETDLFTATATDADGNTSEYTALPEGVSTESGPELPRAFVLRAAYPNPFSRQSTIGFEVPETGHIRIALYDLLGREVVVLVDSDQPAGSYETVLDGRDLTSGIYLVQMTTETGVRKTERVTLVR
jgi:hypothetical protein